LRAVDKKRDSHPIPQNVSKFIACRFKRNKIYRKWL